jgi:predicted Rossmann-fold nucleotide-binding protein
MEYERPLIAVIGASNPGKEYVAEQGILVGKLLREYVDKKGTVFTGGVDGVGVDVYTGVMKYCVQRNTLSDKFFVLIPHYFLLQLRKDTEPTPFAYTPPVAYEALGRLTTRGHLDIIRAGNDMDQRRIELAKLADFVVVVNGSMGTLDEATLASHTKKIITLPETGGIAKLIAALKNNKLSFAEKYNLTTQGVAIEELNVNNVVVSSIDQLMQALS